MRRKKITVGSKIANPNDRCTKFHELGGEGCWPESCMMKHEPTREKKVADGVKRVNALAKGANVQYCF